MSFPFVCIFSKNSTKAKPNCHKKGGPLVTNTRRLFATRSPPPPFVTCHKTRGGGFFGYSSPVFVVFRAFRCSTYPFRSNVVSFRLHIFSKNSTKAKPNCHKKRGPLVTNTRRLFVTRSPPRHVSILFVTCHKKGGLLVADTWRLSPIFVFWGVPMLSVSLQIKCRFLSFVYFPFKKKHKGKAKLSQEGGTSCDEYPAVIRHKKSPPPPRHVSIPFVTCHKKGGGGLLVTNTRRLSPIFCFLGRSDAHRIPSDQMSFPFVCISFIFQKKSTKAKPNCHKKGDLL